MLSQMLSHILSPHALLHACSSNALSTYSLTRSPKCSLHKHSVAPALCCPPCPSFPHAFTPQCPSPPQCLPHTVQPFRSLSAAFPHHLPHHLPRGVGMAPGRRPLILLGWAWLAQWRLGSWAAAPCCICRGGGSLMLLGWAMAPLRRIPRGFCLCVYRVYTMCILFGAFFFAKGFFARKPLFYITFLQLSTSMYTMYTMYTWRIFIQDLSKNFK